MKKFICAAALVLSVAALCCSAAACGFTGSVNTGCKQTSDVVCFARAAAGAPFVREEEPDGEDYESDEENDRETCCGRERGHGPDARGREQTRGHKKHEHEMHERGRGQPGREGGEDERPHPESRGGEIYFIISGHIYLPPAPPAPEGEKDESESPEVLPVLPDGELG